MRRPHWPMALAFALTMLAGAMVGSALRAGFRTLPLHSTDPFLVSTTA